ncbi:uncharacterized protein LOC127836358 isoform X2 [Dreissena polymorpha]|uniref:uncharacterized protein LOC127836358 isoform X2 n=1 Tax=Dreissena polymorpha TaxID=45954 RepID=UPI002263B336|nr:uncharacterized protein LOC127836358 isoform X2 [Dreissena polymorpha]
MSVILSACRNTKQRAIARALKKKADKRLKKEAELQELEAGELDAVTKMWSFEIEGEYYNVVLFLANDKDTVDIFVNDDEITNVMTDVSPEGATFDFLVGSSYKARISCSKDPGQGLVYSLTIDGYKVPECD